MFEFIYRYSVNPRKNLDCKKKLDHLKMLDKNCPLRPPSRENLFQPTILKQVLIVLIVLMLLFVRFILDDFVNLVNAFNILGFLTLVCI